MARASKSRRGQRKQAGEPEAPGGREEQTPEAGTEPADAAPERIPGEEEAAASHEAPLHDKAERQPGTEDVTVEAAQDEDTVAAEPDEPGVAPDEPERQPGTEDITVEAAQDEDTVAAEPDEPGVTPDEPEIAETEPRPELEQAEPDQTEPAPRSSRTWIAGGLILVLALAAIATAWIYGTYGEGQVGWVTAGRLDAVSQRLDEVAAQADRVSADTGQIADRVSAVEGALQDLRSTAEANRQRLDEVAAGIEQLQSAAGEPGDGSGAGEAVGELQSTVEALAARMQELEQGQDSSELSQTIARLEQEIGDLRGQAEAQAEQTQQEGALSQAYAALSEQVAAGEPFANELESVAAQLPGAPGLDELRPLAADGVATVSELQAQLAEVANAFDGGAEEPGGADAGGDLWANLRERLEGAVTIRRADEADWPGVIARADEALQAGDIGTAVTEVEEASDDPPPAIEAWLAAATRARDAEAALDELSAVVLRQLAGRG